MILVTTPNGKVGSEVAKQLLEQGHPVRLGAHTVEKAQAAFPQAEVAPFDFADEDKARAALVGIEALYLASPGDSQAEPVKRVVDLAKEAGVERVVRLSAMGVEASDNPLREVEQHLEVSGLQYTLLRPSWFMQNYSTTNAQSIRAQGAFYEPSGDAKTGFIDARDIAAVAVKALTEDGHHAQAYVLTGGRAYDRYEVAAAISQATGKAVTYQEVSEAQFQEGMTSAGMPEHYVALLTGLYQIVRAGHTAAVTDTVEKVTGRAPTTLEQFARDHKDVWL
jgi:uncharacterized protein YbjT (DUF2867 family)